VEYVALDHANLTAIVHLAFQLAEIFLLLLIFFAIRRWKFGLIPLFVTLATFPLLQINLAISNYVPIYQVSSGWVLLTSTLFIVQLVYIFTDAIELRKLCTVLVFSNVLSTLLMYFLYFFSAHESFKPDATALGMILISALKVMASGTFALMLDLLAIPTVYELLGRMKILPVWLRILITMSVVSVVDSIIFLAGGFHGTLGDSQKAIEFWNLLQRAVLGKLLACVMLTTFLSVYLRWFEHRNDLGRPVDVRLHDLIVLFKYLLYINNDYQPIRDKYSRDEITGVFSGRLLDSYLGAELEQSERAGTPLCLLRVNIDRFGEFRQGVGQVEARRLIKLVADTITTACEGGLVFRMGDDEFAVILRDTGLDLGSQVAESIVGRIKSITQQEGGRWPEPITASCGLASTDEPQAMSSDFSLWRACYLRLCAAKRQGGWQVRSKHNVELVAELLETIAEERSEHDSKFDELLLMIAKDMRTSLVRSRDDMGLAQQPSASRAPNVVEADGSTLENHSGQLVSSGGPSDQPSSLEEGNRLHRLLEQRDAYIRELESRVLGPADSTLIFEQTYEGSVRSDKGDEVVVRYYDAVEDDIIDQVYGKDQFKEGNSPVVDQQIATCVRMYCKSDSSDDGDGAEYEFRPREIISGRVEL
jgi:diguanylate cyclase (GGDEF)-like protein